MPMKECNATFNGHITDDKICVQTNCQVWLKSIVLRDPYFQKVTLILEIFYQWARNLEYLWQIYVLIKARLNGHVIMVKPVYLRLCQALYRIF